jgi:hypothetical protein
MACKSCGGKPAAVVDPRRGVLGSWTVIYPHGAMQEFRSERAALDFIEAQGTPENYTLVDPEGFPVGNFQTASDIAEEYAAEGANGAIASDEEFGVGGLGNAPE